MKNHSFFSGKFNPKSMGIEYTETKTGVKAVFIPKPEYISYFDVVHGGLMSAILDDAMAFSINILGIKAYTAKLEVKFVKPLIVEEKYFVRADILRRRKSFITTEGVIKDFSGNIFITSSAIFIPV